LQQILISIDNKNITAGKLRRKGYIRIFETAEYQVWIKRNFDYFNLKELKCYEYVCGYIQSEGGELIVYEY